MTDHERMWTAHGEQLDPVISATGQWAITEYGVENVRGPYLYSIPWADIRTQPKTFDWTEHMAEKNWVHVPSFEAVYAKAVEMKRTLTERSRAMTGEGPE